MPKKSRITKATIVLVKAFLGMKHSLADRYISTLCQSQLIEVTEYNWAKGDNGKSWATSAKKIQITPTGKIMAEHYIREMLGDKLL